MHSIVLWSPNAPKRMIQCLQKYHQADTPKRSNPNGLTKMRRQPERAQLDSVCQGLDSSRIFFRCAKAKEDSTVPRIKNRQTETGEVICHQGLLHRNERRKGGDIPGTVK